MAAPRTLPAPTRTGDPARVRAGGLDARQQSADFPVGTAFLTEGRGWIRAAAPGGAGMAVMASSPQDRAPAALKWIDYATGTAAASRAIAERSHAGAQAPRSRRLTPRPLNPRPPRPPAPAGRFAPIVRAS